MDRKIILFELNEVPVRIFEHFSRTRPDSALAQRMPRCLKFETYTEDKGWLEPWITWPTLHRGVSNARHEIKDFGQDLSRQDSEFPPLWKILAQRGIRTGVCGSLHTYPMPADLSNYDFFMPDTFAAGSECFPDSISAFQEFNLRVSRGSARNVEKGVPWAAGLQLLRKAPGLGFKLDTMADVGRQLLSERKEPMKRVRRRSFQAILGFDVFYHYLDKERPSFATFFTNHVASSLHRYWAALFPGDYDSFEFTPEWVSSYRDEIDFTMGKFDKFFGRLAAFVEANPEYQLWVATSMGQAATEAKPYDSQLYIVDRARFMRAMGVEPAEWSSRPSMQPQTNVTVAASKIPVFRTAMSKLSLEGVQVVFREAENGFFSIDLGHQGYMTKPQVAQFDGRDVPFKELGLAQVEIEDQAGSNAYHIPQGTLLIYDPLDREPKPGFTQVSTEEIAPTILRNYAVPVPGYMRSPVAFTSGVNR
jgi:hypothetical protein